MRIRQAAIGLAAAFGIVMMVTATILEGDCREVLRTLPERSVQTCITSPPYFGLRDYGTGEWDGGDPACDHSRQSAASRLSSTLGDRARHDGDLLTARTQGGAATYGAVCGRCGARRVDRQIGLEARPDEFVEALVTVFREVRRVLRDDGTVWLNLGSSYASEDGYPIKPTDAAWLAGLIDGEGCIQIHQQRRTGIRDQFQLDLSVGMMTREAVERAYEITRLGSCGQQNRGVWDWSVRGRQTAELLRAIYPFLVTKRRQAALGIMLLDHVAEQRGNRVRPLSDEAIAYREALKRSVSACNQRGEPEIAPRDPKPIALCVKAKDDLMIPHRVYRALMDDGWFGRSDVVWAKPNPMPESVTDRPTRSHEYVFLLSKGPRYFYDNDAIREGNAPRYAGAASGTPRVTCGAGYEAVAEHLQARGSGGNTRLWQAGGAGWDQYNGQGRNKRSVWTVATQPYSGAHFATFPSKLIEPCVLAGSSPRVCGECGAPWQRVVERTAMVVEASERRGAGHAAGVANGRRSTSGAMVESPTSRTVGWEPSCTHDNHAGRSIVLDPFAGAGTVGVVCGWHGRDFIGIELNSEYAQMARDRIALEGRPGGKPNGHEPARVLDGQLGFEVS